MPGPMSDYPVPPKDSARVEQAAAVVPPPVSETPTSPSLHDSAADLEAEAKVLHAKKELIEAKWGFLDRLVMRGAIPIAIAIAAPLTTYYFAKRADDGVAAVERLEAVITKVGDYATEQRVKAAEQARDSAVQVAKLQGVVERLEITTVIQLVRAHVQSNATGIALSEASLKLAPQMVDKPPVTFDSIRPAVERRLYEQLHAHLDAKPELLRQAIQGAVDEAAPDIQRRLSLLGVKVSKLPDQPRFPKIETPAVAAQQTIHDLQPIKQIPK